MSVLSRLEATSKALGEIKTIVAVLLGFVAWIVMVQTDAKAGREKGDQALSAVQELSGRTAVEFKEIRADRERDRERLYAKVEALMVEVVNVRVAVESLRGRYEKEKDERHGNAGVDHNAVGHKLQHRRGLH